MLVFEEYNIITFLNQKKLQISNLPYAATCEDLPLPTNGVITYTNAALPRTQGTIAVQHCNEGYIPSSTSSSSRVCQSDRQWSGVALVCDCK